MPGEKQTFLICGGDLRQVKLANSLAEAGYDTAIYGLGDSSNFLPSVEIFDTLAQALVNRSVVVLPLPCSSDNKTLNAPLAAEPIDIAHLFKQIDKNQIVVAGKISSNIATLAQLYHITIYDYFQREELTVLNAIPTAEGALQIAMEELPYTIHGLSCLVLGFGRIGKLLAKSLVGLGADVTIEARSFADLAWIKAYGYQGLPLHALKKELPRFELIVNTVPFELLDEKMLCEVKDTALIIDLASKPGGVDFDCAAQLGKKVIWALSLPGTVAPVTAGIIIKDTILNLLEELGV